MNTERLVSIIRVLNSEVPGISNTVNQLAQHLQQAINQPQETTQRQVENTLKQLRTALRQAKSNELSPGVLADLETLVIDGVSVAHLVGRGLDGDLEDTFKEGFLSVATLDRVKQIDARLKKLTTALQQATEALNNMGLKAEDLTAGTSVIGMGIPPDAVNGLFGFEREVHFFAFLISDITEIATGQHQDSQLYSLHSSIFGIDVMTALEVAGKFAAAIAGIKSILELLEKYRDLKARAEEIGEEGMAAQLTAKSTQRVEEHIEELTVELFQDCKVDNEGRVNELKNAVRLRLNGVVNRIEKGYTFDVRTALPPQPDEGQKAAAALVEQFRSLRFGPIATPLVLLPEPTPDTEELEAAKAKKPRAGKKRRGKE